MSRGVTHVLDHRARLRVVDDDEVVLLRQRLGVAPVVVLVDRALLLVEALRVSLQRVVDRLRDLEELLLAPDDPPLGLQTGVDHERKQGVVDLRDTAAERGRRQVQDAFSLERGGELQDLVHEAAADKACVIAQLLVAHVDGLQHAAAG